MGQIIRFLMCRKYVVESLLLRSAVGRDGLCMVDESVLCAGGPLIS